MTNLTSLQSHIDSINEKRAAQGDAFRTADANHFFEMYGISTVEEFEAHMDIATFSDWYKDVNGIRPRGFTLEYAREWMRREVENQEAREVAKEAEERRLEEIRESVKPGNRPVNNAMAEALKGWK